MAAKGAKDLAPDAEFKRLEGVLAEGLPPALFLRGDELWYQQKAADLVLAASKQASLEICRHDTADPEFKLPRLLDDLAGGALFAGGRCVLVRGANELLRKGSRVHAPGLGKAILGRMAQGGEGCIVLVGKGLRADNKVLKDARAKGAELFSFRRLWDSPPPGNRTLAKPNWFSGWCVTLAPGVSLWPPTKRFILWPPRATTWVPWMLSWNVRLSVEKS